MRFSSERKPLLSEPGIPLSPLPPATQRAEGAWKYAAPLLLLLYVLLAGMHAIWTPTGETGYQNAPDEAAHVHYAQTLTSGHLPTQADSTQNSTLPAYEWHQPPLYYAWVTLFMPLGPHGMRTASILLGIAALLLIFRAARLLFPDDPLLVVTTTGFAALLPTHIAVTSTINNDVLLECCFSATLLLLIQSMQRGLTTWRAGWIGIAVGAALLTKPTALLLIPIVFLALLLLGRAGEPSTNLRRGAALIVVWMLVISGWWYARNLRLYGELLPLREFDRAFAGTALTKDMLPAFGGAWPYFRLVITWTFESFWAVFGNPKSAQIGKPVFLPEMIYLLPLLTVGTAFAGILRMHKVRAKAFTDVQMRALWLLMITLALVGLSFALFLMKYFQTQGRYLYPALLPLSLLLVLGWLSVFPQKLKSAAAAAFLGMMLLLALLFMSCVQAVSQN